ncbi:autotransporter domain-containing protein [Desulfovibrio piger]|nr:autotransporter domain-containing protein [Desulfovibrio piger]
MCLTKNALGMLLNRYRSVLKKCHALNIIGGMALVGALTLGATGSCAEAAGMESATDISVTNTLTTATTDAQGNVTYGDVSAAGNISAFDESKPAGQQAYDIEVGNITAGGAIKGGDITTHGDLTADHVETFPNADPTLQDAKGNPGTVTVNGAVNLPGNSTTGRRLDIINTVGSHNVLGNVTTGACISIQGNGTEKSTLTAGVLAVGGGSFTIADGMQATVKEVSFNIDGRKARIHGGNTNAATILDLDKFIMHNGNILAEASWESKYAMGVIRNVSPDDTRPGLIIGDGNIAVGANAMLGLGEGATLDWLYNLMKTSTGHEAPTQDGVRSVLALNRPLEVQNGFRVFINGDLHSPDLKFPASTTSDNDSPFVTTMEQSGTFTQGANTMLVINGDNEQVHYTTGSQVAAGQVPGAISYVATAGDGSISLGDAKIEAGSKLLITGAQTGETYVVLGDGFDKDKIEFVKDETGADTAWKGDNLLSDNPLVSLTRGDDGTVSGEARSASQVFSGLDSELVAALDSANLDHKIGTGEQYYSSGEKGTQFLSRALRMAGYGNADAAATTIESATRIAAAGAVPQMTKMASDAATNAVVNRLGFAKPENGAKAVNAEGMPVNDKALGLALWIAPLWSNQNAFGMKAGNYDYGYNANLGGVSLGADYTWSNNLRAGLMFNVGGGYSKSAGGDLSDTTNNMTFWGLGAYGGWEYSNFAIMADVSYTSTWNSVSQDLDSRMGMGDLEADIQASAISAGLRGEYKFETSVLDIIPHISVRYMSLNTWGYDVEGNGGTVLEGDGFQQNIWTFPVGITFSKELDMGSDWYFKPSIDFSAIPAAGDIKAKADTRFTGLPYSTSLETQTMDYFTWQGGVGVEFGNDNMSVGVNYTLQTGQHSTGHGVFGMFRYEF